MRAILALLLMGLSIAGACAQTREVQATALAAYQPYLGEPVEQFRFHELQSWQLVGDLKVVVFPRLNEAWLLTVDAPCTELQWTHSIGLSSSVHVVHRRFDFVVAGKDRCRINEIRPIDYKAYRDARKGKAGVGTD